MGGELTVDSWGEALAAVHGVDFGTDIRVPKSSEPTLPGTVDLRSSNFPWSIHKGAIRVFRENEAGAHLQIREFPDYWTVQRDRSNPHYRPVSHARTDVPAMTAAMSVASFPIFTYLSGLRLAGHLSAQAADLSVTVLADGVVPLVNAVFK
ncbi:hypothetical protein [Halorientalis salina]|uniref:hypothetical protein n=1 Tax=Halorientalis salina TaxID=2932266 RepID=UPI0010ABB98B|nr:hypothetical protein [Halorientalis salina]